MKTVELLAPAGNLEKLKTALHYGADAVYLGGRLCHLRAGSGNFSDEELSGAIAWAHARGKKVYITLNTIPHNGELDQLPAYVRFLESVGADGVIVADLGVFAVVREESGLPISVSTQASNTNWRSVRAWRDMGASRVVLAREMTLDEIKEIRDRVPDMELEVFVHGAMCMAVSGRCVLSNHLTGRDANRGDCAQSCRWRYAVVEEKRPGQYMPVIEDERGSYIFSAKDLCAVEFLDRILDAGVDSLKIEGRMKGIYYVGNCVKVYREAIDRWKAGKFAPDPRWLEELAATSNRLFSPGFYFGRPGKEGQNDEETQSYFQTKLFVAKVEKKLPDGRYLLAIRNRVVSGQELEVVSPRGENRTFTLPAMTLVAADGDTVTEAANPNSFVKIACEVVLEEWDMLRRKLK
ncbi:MAG: U32 family peptidase [Fusobacteriaceae bacterium]|jgi:putative protease|nr:U32 family peptidase [Fusobacteriaceae bacterium]